MLAKHPKKTTAARESIEHLSRTDLEILTHIGKGETSAEIAENLNLATTTVRNYISAVLHKTGLRNRTQMVRYALEHGLVPLADGFSEPIKPNQGFYRFP
jgi:DNA-binding NarL/FixJ family response regulator